MLINLDKESMKKKPENGSAVSKRIASCIDDLTLEEIADAVGNKGRAFTRAYLIGGRKTENFKMQKLLVLDFDGTFEYSDFIKRCEEYDIPFAFTYKTLSCKERERFRAVFVLDEWINNLNLALAINVLMQKFFDDADGSCKDVNRMFYGGKGIIDMHLDKTITIPKLVRSFETYLKVEKGLNYSHRLKTVAKKMKVEIIDGKLGIFDKSKITYNDSECKSIIDGQTVMFFRNEELADKKCNSIQFEKEKIIKISGHDENSLCLLCLLLKDFMEGADLQHQQKFLLATSLAHIKNGDKIFFSKIEEDKVKKWKIDWKNNIKGYRPKNCNEELCPYYRSCKGKSLYNKASKRIWKTTTVNEYFNLEDCEEDLRKCIERAVDTEDRGIHVIKAQTGLGKTEQYCNIVRDRQDKTFIIAVPTIKLEYEVAERLAEKGVPCEVTESLYKRILRIGLESLSEIVEQAYANGFGRRIVKIVRSFLKEHKDELTDKQIEEVQAVISKKSRKNNETRCIVMTHAFFLMKRIYECEEYKDYEIIIDEDILMTLFRQTSKISTKTIKYLLELDWMSDENEIFLGKILKMKNDQILQTTGSALTEIELDELYKVGGRLDGPAAMLFESSYVGKYNDEIIFIKKEYMMRKSKWIVLSATANQELYANYFKGEEICFQKVHQAKYKGSVIQRTAYPMSRRFINLNEKDKIIEGIEKILKNDIPLISFKMLFPDSQIHFGKTEGFDEYSGKDIAVVGTPHNAPILYKLVGEVLGYGVAEKMAVRRIEKNEYSFPFMTFGSEDMQNLQTFFIETELEQAIGRARILRNDCTVYVFSNYPVQQAELIQEPYLELQDIADENEDVEEY